MILKVDRVSTQQFQKLVAWLATSANHVTLDEVNKMEHPIGAKPVVEITRDKYRRHANMDVDLRDVVRVISVKSKLVIGNVQEEHDSYDIALEVPQYMCLQRFWKEGCEQCPAPDMVPIPDRIMKGILAILANGPLLSEE